MNQRNLWACFFLPLLLLLLLLGGNGVTPFGDGTLLLSDMDSQYVEFLSEYRRVLLGKGSFAYSWNAGMGMSFPALIAYYLASPFNLLLVFFAENQMPAAVTCLTVLKLSAAGWAFGLYLRRREGNHRILPLFAMAYALSAYALGYCFNIMWLDALIWLPLLCTECDRLREDGGWVRLCLLFALSFFSHFYTAWMTGLFTAIYFTAQTLTEKRHKVRGLFRFGMAVGFAAMLSAFLWLPTYLTLKNNMGLMGQSAPLWETQFDLWKLPVKFLPLTYDGFKDCLPHLYCGALAVIGFVAFLGDRRGLKKRRFLLGGLALLLLLSFWLHPLDFVWHALDHPSWFPYRYAFLWVFVTLSGAYAWWKRVRMASVLAGVLTLLAVTECCVNGGAILSDHVSKAQSVAIYEGFNAPYRQGAVSALPDEGAFWRVEKNRFRVYNDPMGIGFPGISHFSSTASVGQSEFLKRMGFDCYATWCTHEGATRFSDAFLNIRGLLREAGGADLTDEVFPLFFFAPETLARMDFHSDALDPLQRQEQIAALLGHPDLFRQETYAPEETVNLTAVGEEHWAVRDGAREAEIRYEIPPAEGVRYLFIPSVSLNYDVFLNGEEIFNAGRNFVPYPVLLPEGEPCEVRVRPVKGGDYFGPLRVYTMDADVLRDTVADVRGDGPVTERRGYAAFTLTMEPGDEPRLLMSSVSFDSGWRIRAGGADLSPRKIWGGLLGVNVPAGCNRVDIAFTPYGFHEGLIISMSAIPLMAVAVFFTRKRDRL